MALFQIHIPILDDIKANGLMPTLIAKTDETVTRLTAGLNVGDVRSVLGAEQEPWVVPLTGAETTAALSRALAELAADPHLRDRLGRTNRSKAESEYDFQTMLAAYRGLYLDAAQS